MNSHLLPSHIENAFKYLLDQDESSSERNIIVNGIVDFNGSPHKNKKAYSIDLIYSVGTQNYNSKIGINLYSLPIGKYTVIMEYFFPEDTNIYFVAGSSTTVINKQVTTSFTDHKKHLVQIDQQSKDTPDYLFFNIRGSATTSTNPEGYLVFYGIKGWVDFVPPRIYDKALESSMFEYDGGKMKMNMDLDMNGNSILSQPTTHWISGVYKKSLNKTMFTFSGGVNFLFPKYCKIVGYSLYIMDNLGSYPELGVKITNIFYLHQTGAKKFQDRNLNILVNKGERLDFQMHDNSRTVDHCLITLIIEEKLS